METTFFQGLIMAAAVSLIATFIFLAVAKTGLLVTRKSKRRSAFAGTILFEAGHRFRQQMSTVDATTSVHATAALMFLIVFLTVAIIRAPAITMPPWAWLVGAMIVTSGVCFIPYSVVRLLHERAQLAYVRDAHIAIGHALHGTSMRGSRVFHDVSAGRLVIDHVVVGSSGVYAVSVVVRSKHRGMFSREAGCASLKNDSLDFDGTKDPAAVAHSVRIATHLSAALSKVTTEPVKVRSVIAVPGWRVGGPSPEHMLLVNEKNLVMLTGWTSKDSYLMDDDVDQVIKYLSQCCRV